MGTALFKYSLSPSSVPYSAAEASVVEFTISVTNPSPTPTPVQSLAFLIPAGNTTDALCLNPGSLVASPGPQTPWGVAPQTASSTNEDGTIITAMPLPPVNGLGGNETIDIVFSNVLVNQLSGSVQITIKEQTATLNEYSVEINKSSRFSPLSPASPYAPQIAVFSATPDEVAQDGQTLLSWYVIGAISCYLQTSFPLQSITTGALPLTIRQTATYTLTAVSASGAKSSGSVTVAVMPVIASFESNAGGAVSPGSKVTLSWDTQFAYSCSMDQGIGPVPLTGSVVVSPQTTTTYTLTATGLDTQTPQVTITVES